MDKQHLEAMALSLENSGHYRVLRRLEPTIGRIFDPNTPTRLGIVVDVETTGLDARLDEVIELSMVPFEFTPDGTIVDIRPAFQRLRQPTRPIPASISILTGITDAMVQGFHIDPNDIERVLQSHAHEDPLLISHNASFDRRFAERLHPAFAQVPWGCSMSQVPWTLAGAEGVKLGYLLIASGLFHDGHRGETDCNAALALLARPLGDTGRTALSHLLEATDRATWRLRAVNAPFAQKDRLRSRGYRWNDGADGRPRAWFIDLEETAIDAEVAFLQAEIFGPDWRANLAPITAWNRFSDRV